MFNFSTFHFSDPNNLIQSIIAIIGDNDPRSFLFSLTQKFQYFRCCDEAYVTNPQNDVCHNQAVISKYYNLTEFIGNNPIMNVTAVTWDSVKENFECLEIKSFFTYDELYGLNINLLWLFLSALLFVGILILIETGLLRRLWNSSPKKVIEKLFMTSKLRIFFEFFDFPLIFLSIFIFYLFFIFSLGIYFLRSLNFSAKNGIYS